MTKSHTQATLQTIVNTLDQLARYAQKPGFASECAALGIDSPASFMAGVTSVENYIRDNYLGNAEPAKKPCLVLAFDNTKRKP